MIGASSPPQRGGQELGDCLSARRRRLQGKNGSWVMLRQVADCINKQLTSITLPVTASHSEKPTTETPATTESNDAGNVIARTRTNATAARCARSSRSTFIYNIHKDCVLPPLDEHEECDTV